MAEMAKNDPGQWKFIGIEGMNKKIPCKNFIIFNLALYNLKAIIIN